MDTKTGNDKYEAFDGLFNITITIDMPMAGLEWTTGDRPSSRRTWKT